MKKTGMRNETDEQGVVSLPADAFWGIATVRALEICSPGPPVPETLLTAIAILRKAFAAANGETGKVHNRLTCAIAQSADEVRSGKWHDQFPVSLMMPAAANVICRNVDEVLANRANHMLGSSPGAYDPVSVALVTSGLSGSHAFAQATAIGCLIWKRDLDAQLRDMERLLRRTAVEFERAAKNTSDSSKSDFANQFNQHGALVESRWRSLSEASAGLCSMRLKDCVEGLPSLPEDSLLSLVTEKLEDDISLKLTLSDTKYSAAHLLGDLAKVLAAIKSLAFELAGIARDLRRYTPARAIVAVPAADKPPNDAPPAVPEARAAIDYAQMLDFVSAISYHIEGNEKTVAALSDSTVQVPTEISPLVTSGLFNSFEAMTRCIAVFCKACTAVMPENLS